MTGPLTGRVALVTGGSRGVGRSVASRLARDGATVAITYRREAQAAAEVVDEIGAFGGRARAYQVSIDDVRAVESMVDTIASDLGAVDLLVSNAGSASRGTDIDDLDASSPFGRVCRPEDVAGAVAFLVSADSEYMTGQRLVVDGGGPKAAIF
ncbi:SDR family oxidoreductase [Gordonia McavH-238-E]|uniref:SDR family NAD(P)-dependent oxidoreductase n=1 Tax=Gordonia sp. McavH-238-E TaxID=2917736 RepID=UPI001EF4B4EE|nr:SDR family oxidoreductase [Gordonia sp. McavH-238-E]MCG7633605.1 SDR family oxidoreductase [Gordonia sp. McavH-238-E]